MPEYATGRAPSRSDPGRRLVAITPDDDDELTQPPRALYIGGAGDVAVVAIDDSAPVVFTAVPAGTILPVSVVKVRATGTTASDIVAIL